MADFDWKSALQAVAPGLASAFGGPLVGAAVKVIGDKLLGNPNASQADVEEALSGGLSGEQVVALREAENTFKLEMERIDAQRDQASLADAQNARQQTVALAQAGSNIAWAPVVISTIITLGFFACVVLLFVIDRAWDERQANLLNTLFGGLLLGFGQVCNYWLGSSAGSKRSGDAVRKLAEIRAAK
ncbi:hypothetical protein DBA29_17320 [Xenophilus aerolatus]|nr:hypothetical protein [Xenophilus aerolatus]